MLSVLFLFLSLVLIGAAVGVAYRPFPIAFFGSATGANLVLGAIAGAMAAGLVRLMWRYLAPALRREGVEVRLFNGLILGAAVALIGVLLARGVRWILPIGSGLRAAGGVLLILGAATGLRVGVAFDRPVWGGGGAGSRRGKRRSGAPNKILDTSIIIDGRIAALLATGFLEGEVIVPEFVLAELQNIADSSNSLRRRKGRRGLDVLNQLMQDDGVSIRVVTTDYPDIREVDRKLLRLARETGASLITTDYNLNRVGKVEGVRILNVNELATAVKPRFIPGEDITLEILDRGEEINQGVGYLDDGTMVVVENGRRHIGRKIKATVKSTLQTEAGRMLFAEPAGQGSRWER